MRNNSHIFEKYGQFSGRCCHENPIPRLLCEVERLLSCLNDRQRELVRRCVIEGWSYTEIAAKEGRDESAVRHAVKRALKKMKKTFF